MEGGDRAMARAVTIIEIAEAAKVSPATVSRALNKTARVSPQVERRIRIAMAKLGVSQDQARDTLIFCFLLANRPMLHPFHAKVLMGVQEFASEHESPILFYAFQYDTALPPEDILLPPLVDRRGLADGYVVGGITSANLLNLLAKTGVPFSVLGNNVVGPWTPEVFDVVWTDDARGTFEAVQYLQGLEHRAIWFLRNSPRVNPVGLSIHAPSERIYEGYRQAMEAAGLEPQCIENDSADERDTGYLAVKSLLTHGGKVTAFFAASDLIAQGAYDAVRDCGLRIPDDISIVGFGDRPEAAALTPPLSTIWAYADQVGRRLAEFVFKRINNAALPPQSVVLPTRLVIRSSCSRPPTSSP